ncbi:MAG: NADH-quinone oxidoreductase subunit NuoK [Planctomycetes bacterium]|nr:NADH-quinone oxidoreductase subunit NuoK [Planctomycetota bacterium]
MKYIALSAVVFSIGAYGAIARRNLLIVLMSIELMLNGVNVALIAFARHYWDSLEVAGHAFVLMVMAVAAAEVGVGLALMIALFRTRKTVDAGELRELKG